MAKQQDSPITQRLQRELLANVSHEMRTPLNGILGFAKLLRDDLVDPQSPRYKECITDIISSAEQLLTLINDLLDFARLEAGKMSFRPVKTNLCDVLDKTRLLFMPLIKTKGLHVDINIDPLLTHVMIDPSRLKQILYNYLSNAIKFTPDKGHITVRIFPEMKKNFRIEVSDTGIGIRKKDLPHLFVEFQQFDTRIKKAQAGTGIGLALTKRLVEAQGGKVGVTSQLRRGSTFYAVLPVSPCYHRIVKKEST